MTAALPEDATPDVLVDFSSPLAFESLLALCLDRKIPLVYATTGLSDAQIARLEDAAKTIPVLRSPSMSPAVNLTMKLAQIAARALKKEDKRKKRGFSLFFFFKNLFSTPLCIIFRKLRMRN